MENKVLSLVSRGNQGGISKLITTPQLTETIIINRNSKEHTKIKLIKKSCLN